MSLLELWTHQAEMIDTVADRDESALCESPTGSGKTTLAIALLAQLFAKGSGHAIVIAPQQQIEEGFVARNGVTVKWPGRKGRRLLIPAAFIRQARHGEGGSAREILQYLATPSPGYALACTHAAFNFVVRHHADQLPADLSTAILLVDEAHHAAADQLTKAVDLWEARGGRLLYFSATPYRGDGRELLRKGMIRLRRSITEHMRSGLAPEHLEHEIVPFGAKGDKVAASEFRGDSVTQDAERQAELVRLIVQRWHADGRPKAIVRVPPMPGGSGGVVQMLAAAFGRKRKTRVLDATGTDAASKRRFLAAMATERGKTHAESQYDVVIGIQRVLEGTDWPVCSHVYSVGIPGSLQTVVQLLGRTMRKKDDAHPSRNQVKISFFVPCAGGEALDTLSIEHSRHALMVAVYLADHKVGEEWVVVQSVREGIRTATGKMPSAVEPIDPAGAIDPQTYALIRGVMANEQEKHGTRTVGQLIEAAREALPGVDEADINTVAVYVAAGEESLRGRVGAAIQRKVAERVKIRPEIHAAMEEVFREVVAEFRNETLTVARSLREVVAQTHRLTGGRMEALVERLRGAWGQGGPLTFEMIRKWVQEWQERTGNWPSAHSGMVPDSGAQIWENIDSAIKNGHRGLPKGAYRSIADFIDREFGRKSRTLTFEMIRGWVEEWVNKHSSRPNVTSGDIPGSSGENWLTISQCIRKGARGLPGGVYSGLLDFMDHECASLKTALTFDMIRKWSAKWFTQYGNYPSRESGVIPRSGGATWMQVDDAIRRGGLGITKGSYSGIEDFIYHAFVFRNKQRLSFAMIHKWVDEWFKLHGSWPTYDSGEIPSSGGENWVSIHRAIKNGHRGLPKGAYRSIADFIDREFGRKSRTLTFEMIRGWVEEWRKRYGETPTRNAVEIPNSSGETWGAVHQAINTGGRGLPKGVYSGLPDFINREFGRAKKTCLTFMMIRQWVLEWHDKHKQYPSSKSGEIPKSGGERWQCVHCAIRGGGRGLPKGVYTGLPNFIDREFSPTRKTRLTFSDIRQWVKEWHSRSGVYPTQKSGEIPDSGGENWSAIDQRIHCGGRGLPKGVYSSLADFINREFRNKPEPTTASLPKPNQAQPNVGRATAV